MPTPERRRGYPSPAEDTPQTQPPENPKQQPPRQHNADLAARYSRTMAEARSYRNPPLLRRAFLILFVLLLLWTASRLQLRARTQVRKWQFLRDSARGSGGGGEEEGWVWDDAEGWSGPGAGIEEGEYGFEAAERSIWESFGLGALLG
ncbi:hypothetical protein CF319_g2656 [Tilletia indica]|nr:hypothetical protein CF319_g2656 [Tilletia indica]